MTTLNDILVMADNALNDPGGTTFPYTERLSYLKDALDIAYSQRPDLFFGGYPYSGATLFTTATSIDSIPFPESKIRLLAGYVEESCLKKDPATYNPSHRQQTAADKFILAIKR
jgi:hypothetical protein